MPRLPPPHPPHLPVTKTKQLVASIWHLAALTRLHEPMVGSVLSAPHSPGGGLGLKLPAQEVGCVHPSVCQHILRTELRGPPEGQAGRGRAARPAPAAAAAWPWTSVDI